MAHQQVNVGFEIGKPPLPGIRKLSDTDIRLALRKGYEDFQAKPSHVVFLGLLYPILCFLILFAAAGRELLPLIYPLIAGFALIGPFAAIGLYEISRERERGETPHWRQAFGVMASAGFGQLLLLGIALLVIFSLWLLTALVIYDFCFGATPFADALDRLFTTRNGWMLLLLGNGVGFLFALFVLIISAVSFPMILDRHVDAVTAVRTSMAVFAHNPVVMLKWGAVIAGALALGFIPLAIGLAIVFPILGHATWHVYRAAVH
ncbi:MAG: DUF2189 domain-containing protein [Rhodothalassiaceae bacterium]